MPLNIQEHKSLKSYNTFSVEASARFFVEIEEEGQLPELFAIEKFESLPKLIIGGGSNVLFTRDFEGLVVFINIKGVYHSVDQDYVQVQAGAGEVWNELVQYCVKRNFYGIENLSLIPGTVGAAPVQNIGAYGVELKDVFHSCEAFDTQARKFRSFIKEDCSFGYRDSIFKSKHKGRFILTKLRLNLSKVHSLNTSYGAIEEELGRQRIFNPTLQDVSAVVSKIRVSKLPDPTTIGNSGSFFKNPIVERSVGEKLHLEFPELVSYPVDGGERFKLAAGWLIEQCGWKGIQVGNTGTWKNQALVLVNHGNATGKEIFEFSERIVHSVQQKFGVELAREVNVI